MTTQLKPPHRVLMLLEDWCIGGTEEYVSRLADYLRRRESFEVYIVVLRRWDANLLPKAADAADAVYCLGGSLSERLRKLHRLTRRLAPDVCHCHLYSSLLPVTLLLRALRVPRIVTTLHMPVTAWNWRRRMSTRLAAALVDRVVCNSSAVAQSLDHSHPDGQRKSIVVPPPFSPFQTALPTAREVASPFVVSGCGRLSPEKDWQTLLHAFSKLHSQVDGPVRLVLVGNGPLEETLRRLAAELGIGDFVTFTGAVAHPEAMAMLRQSDVSVLPSRFEGLGMAAIEAMQCGVPTITADFEASADFIEHNVTGHRFPRGDSESLADLLLWHYRNPKDSRAMGRRGQDAVAKQYSEENTFARYPSVYLEKA
ncbi:MAG: glycosyltransferase family 4 protein [Pirellulales bacterium]|nr:glycosyltransferase family 4 protein [Pirellulales bacterium]